MDVDVMLIHIRSLEHRNRMHRREACSWIFKTKTFFLHSNQMSFSLYLQTISSLIFAVDEGKKHSQRKNVDCVRWTTKMNIRQFYRFHIYTQMAPHLDRPDRLNGGTQ